MKKMLTILLVLSSSFATAQCASSYIPDDSNTKFSKVKLKVQGNVVDMVQAIFDYVPRENDTINREAILLTHRLFTKMRQYNEPLSLSVPRIESPEDEIMPPYTL